MMFLFLILVIAAVYFLLENDSGFLNRRSRHRDPVVKLEERFVDGEIDEETYLKMKRTLEK